MSQVTIRGIKPNIEKTIRQIAREHGKSMNQVLKEIIHKEFQTGPSAPASGLKQLAGGWSREEAEEFERSISLCERIDEDMWR